MTTRSHFVLENETSRPVQFQMEPEAVPFRLRTGENATVHDAYEKKPVTLRLTEAENGDLVIAVWPGDGDVVVEKCGKDVLGAV